MAFIWRFTLAAVSMFGLALACAPASADSVEQFYTEKTVTIMIGYSPGGTDDLWARLIAQHLM